MLTVTYVWWNKDAWHDEYAALARPVDVQQAGKQVIGGSNGLSCLYMVILEV